MPRPIPIVSLSELDPEATYALYVHCFREESARLWSPQEWNDMLKRHDFNGFALIQDDQPISFVSYLALADEVEILHLGTAPDYRHHGYGYTILNETLKILKLDNVTRCFLEVDNSNHHAIKLYESCGFTAIGRRQNYYHNGQDAIILEKQL